MEWGDKMDKAYDFGSLPITLAEERLCAATVPQEMTHWHDSLELIQVRKGEIHCHVNDSDFLLGSGELCFINKGQLHRVYCTNPEPSELSVLIVNTSILEQNEAVYEKYIRPVIQDPRFTHIRVNRKNGAVKIIAELLRGLGEQGALRPAGYELDVMGFIYMIFSRLYQIHARHEDPYFSFDSDVALQRKMNTYIYEHYSERVTLNDIAAAADVSRSKCSAMFQKYSQKSPIAFLNSYRLEVSARLLRSTDASIGLIAQSCGFGEQSYFNRLFAREYGCTPLAYRRGGTALTLAAGEAAAKALA